MPSRKTPAWILLGGAWLAFTAGYVNAIGFLGAQQHGLTHVTGQITSVGIQLSRADLGATFRAAMLVGWFFAGAVLSGAVIRRPELSARGRRYGVAMGLEAGLLAAGAILRAQGAAWGDDCLAMAAGLQNALATSYSGAVIRTTHMTGLVTDLGILVGHLLRGHAPEWPRAALQVVLLGSFLAGGAVGAVAFGVLVDWALAPPVVAMAFASLGYTWRTHHVPDPHRHGAPTDPRGERA